MSTFACNANNDLYADSSGNLVFLQDGLQATLEDCAHAAKTLLGEMVLATDKGIPYLTLVFNNYTPDAFRDALITSFLQVANVVDVLECVVAKVGSVVTYRATIQTSFGTGAING